MSGIALKALLGGAPSGEGFLVDLIASSEKLGVL
jgi:hypothetical protein